MSMTGQSSAAASMKLDKIYDPRGKLEKLSRKELEYLARHEGRTDIQPGMPRLLMMRIFQQSPPAKVPHPQRAQLGEYRRLVVPPYETWVRVAFGEAPPPPEEATVVETSAADDLAMQWEREQQSQRQPTSVTVTDEMVSAPANPLGDDFTGMKMYELRKVCKQRGIAFSRTDKMAVLKEKLRGQDTSSVG